MSLPSARSETLYVTRRVKSDLEAVAMLASANAVDDAPLASVDAMADQILRDHLATIPRLAERKRKIRKAIAEIDAEEAQQRP